MLDEEKANLGKIVNWAYKWDSCPFFWDFKKGTFILNNKYSRQKLRGLLIVTIYWWTYLSYLTYRVVKGITQGHPYKDATSALCFVVIALGIPVGICFLLMIFKGEEFATTTNAALHSLDDFYKKFALDGGKFPNPWFLTCVKIAFQLLLLGSKFLVLLEISGTAYNPYDKIYLSNLVPEKYRCFPIALIQIAFTARVILSLSSLMANLFAIHIMQGMCFFCMQDQVNMKTKKYWTKTSLRTIPVLKMQFMMIWIFLSMLHTSTSAVAMPLQIALLRAVSICNYFVMRYRKEMPLRITALFLGVSVAFTIGWLGILYSTAQFHTLTFKIFKSWKQWPSPFKASIRRKKIWKKELKFIRPMAVQMSNICQIKKKTVLTVGAGIVRGTMRLLVAFRKTKH